MSESQVWRLEVPDRAGRGAVCSTIHQLAKDLQRVMPQGPGEDDRECRRLLRRLDGEREKFGKLYPGVKPKQED